MYLCIWKNAGSADVVLLDIDLQHGTDKHLHMAIRNHISLIESKYENGDEKFIFLLNSDDQQVLTWVGKFIYDSFKTRNEKLV